MPIQGPSPSPSSAMGLFTDRQKAVWSGSICGHWAKASLGLFNLTGPRPSLPPQVASLCHLKATIQIENGHMLPHTFTCFYSSFSIFIIPLAHRHNRVLYLCDNRMCPHTQQHIGRLCFVSISFWLTQSGAMKRILTYHFIFIHFFPPKCFLVFSYETTGQTIPHFHH